MKTRSYGRSGCSGNDRRVEEWELYCAYDDYVDARLNGAVVAGLPSDWTLGYNSSSGRYEETPHMKAWMEENDRNYVNQLAREGTLAKTEPLLATEVPKLYAEIEELYESWGLMQCVKLNAYDDIILSLLKRSDAKAINALDGDGKNALHCASQVGNFATVKALVEKGADVLIKDNSNLTARNLAKAGNHLQVAGYLKKHTPDLLAAIIAQMQAQMPWLRFDGINPVAKTANPVTTNNELTAAAVYHAPLLNIEQEVFPSNAIDPAVEVLEDLCCPITGCIMIDPVSTCDNQTYEREAIEEWFKSHDTSPLSNAKLANKTLNENVLARKFISTFLAMNPQLRGSAEVYLPKAKLLAIRKAIEDQNLAKVKDLIKDDHRVLARFTAPGRTAFHAACEIGTLEILKHILSVLKPEELNAILALAKPENWQPAVLNQALFASSVTGDIDQISFNLHLGANIDARDNEWMTPLCKAAEAGQINAVDLLLANGADHSLRDSRNNAPLDLAILNGHNSVVNLLMERKGLPHCEAATQADFKYLMLLRYVHDQLKNTDTLFQLPPKTVPIVTLTTTTQVSKSNAAFFADKPSVAAPNNVDVEKEEVDDYPIKLTR